MRHVLVPTLLCALSWSACSSDDSSSNADATGGNETSITGGLAGSGGETMSSGGSLDSGGAQGSGGSSEQMPTGGDATGGSDSTGGTGGSGGSDSTGGGMTSGGAVVTGGDSSGGSPSSGGTMVVLPPENAPFDYQLGGDYTPPAGVQIVSRDRQGQPAAGLYNICYVNGLQTQPGEDAFWLNDHPELLLRDGGGQPIIDPDWPDEYILDISTADNRSAIASIVGGWIEGCSQDGFDAVEIDNLDTYSRSGGRIDEDDAVAFIRLLADVAHANGLAIAQKNSAEIVGRKGEMGTDFAVAEECNTWDECDVYQGAYGNHVLVIEYVRADFDKGCNDYPELSIVYRDVQLRTPGKNGYVYDGC